MSTGPLDLFFFYFKGGPGVAKIGIVTAASATPLESGYFYKNLFLETYGVLTVDWIPIDESRSKPIHTVVVLNI